MDPRSVVKVRNAKVKSTDTKESEQSSGEHPTGMSRKEGLQGGDRKVEAKESQ